MPLLDKAALFELELVHPRYLLVRIFLNRHKIDKSLLFERQEAEPRGFVYLNP